MSLTPPLRPRRGVGQPTVATVSTHKAERVDDARSSKADKATVRVPFATNVPQGSIGFGFAYGGTAYEYRGEDNPKSSYAPQQDFMLFDIGPSMEELEHKHDNGTPRKGLNHYDPVEPEVAARMQQDCVIDPSAPAKITPYLISLFGENNLRRDWNEEFQRLFDEPFFTTEQVNKASAKKSALYQEFLQFSHRVASRLVDQLRLPAHSRRIQPETVCSGYAGGEKFRIGNLFCKFARDDKKLYNGRDDLAIKMAKNEVRNGNAVLQLGLWSLHLSMMACHQIRGHAVITTAWMPVSSDTLVYGSDDAGRTYRKLNQRMNALMDRVGTMLGLAPHKPNARGSCDLGPSNKLQLEHPKNAEDDSLVGKATASSQTMTLAVGADCEGHISLNDGRMYLLDLGRMVPPNSEAHPQCLVEQFRHEYLSWRMQHRMQPLSADAFTIFGRSGDNPAVQTAIKHYFCHHIPLVCNRVVNSDWSALLNGTKTLAAVLHAGGVNLRHLGHVFNFVYMDRNGGSSAETYCQMVLQEMAIRTLKCIVRERLRAGKYTAEDLNNFSPDHEITQVDPKELIDALLTKYSGVVLDEDQKDAIEQLVWAEVLPADDHKGSSSKRIRTSGHAPKERRLVKVAFNYIYATCFKDTVDVVQPAQMPSVNLAESQLLDEIELREHTLGKNNREVLPTLLLLLKLYTVWHQQSPYDTLAKADEIVKRLLAIADTLAAVERARVLNECGLFWYQLSNYSKACPFFEQALKLAENACDPSSPLRALLLGNVGLMDKMLGRFTTAELCFKRALALSEQHPSQGSTSNLVIAGWWDKLGDLHLARRAYSESEAAFKTSLRLRGFESAQQDVSVIGALRGLARLYTAQNLPDQSLQMLQRALHVCKIDIGAETETPELAAIMQELGDVYVRIDRVADGRNMIDRSWRIRQKWLGYRNPAIADSYLSLAQERIHQKDYKAAMAWLDQRYELYTSNFGQTHPFVADALQSLGECQLLDRRLPDAEGSFWRALRMRQDLLGEKHSSIIPLYKGLGGVHELKEDYHEAFSWYRRQWRMLEDLFGPEYEDVAEALCKMAQMLEHQARWLEAYQAYDRGLVIRKRLQVAGKDDPVLDWLENYMDQMKARHPSISQYAADVAKKEINSKLSAASFPESSKRNRCCTSAVPGLPRVPSSGTRNGKPALGRRTSLGGNPSPSVVDSLCILQ